MRAVRPERFRFHNLPLIFAAAKRDGLFFGGQFNTGNFVRIKDQQPLIAQVGRIFEQGTLVVARHGKHAGVSRQCCVRATACRRIISDQELLSLSIFLGNRHFDGRLSQAVLIKTCRLVFDKPV